MAVLGRDREAVVVVLLLFATGRGLVTLSGWAGRRILALMDKVVQLRGSPVSLGIVVATVTSRIRILAALVAVSLVPQ